MQYYNSCYSMAWYGMICYSTVHTIQYILACNATVYSMVWPAIRHCILYGIVWYGMTQYAANKCRHLLHSMVW